MPFPLPRQFITYCILFIFKRFFFTQIERLFLLRKWGNTMKCERLLSLVKNWYMKVQDESMAPARMVAFMEKHITQCEECLADPDVKQETAKIREIVLPPSKVPKPKAVRVPKPEIAGEEEETGEAAETAEAETAEGEDVDAADDDDNGDEAKDYDPDLLDEEDDEI